MGLRSHQHDARLAASRSDSTEPEHAQEPRLRGSVKHCCLQHGECCGVFSSPDGTFGRCGASQRDGASRALVMRV